MDEDGDYQTGKWFCRLGFLMYVASFVVPAMGVDGGSRAEWFWGAKLFVCGLVYCWFLPMSYAWWANLLFWIALGLWRDSERARNWSAFAGVLALSFLMVADLEFINVPYVFWTASMFLFALGSHVKSQLEP